MNPMMGSPGTGVDILNNDTVHRMAVTLDVFGVRCGAQGIDHGELVVLLHLQGLVDIVPDTAHGLHRG